MHFNKLTDVFVENRNNKTNNADKSYSFGKSNSAIFSDTNITHSASNVDELNRHSINSMSKEYPYYAESSKNYDQSNFSKNSIIYSSSQEELSPGGGQKIGNCNSDSAIVPDICDSGSDDANSQSSIELINNGDKNSRNDSPLSQKNSQDAENFEELQKVYPFTRKLMNNFKTIFGLKTFRKNQLETINSIMSGKDCFVLMPTGGGKSLCYQLPATVKDGVTIVISPLRSLITDQVSKLQMLNIPAAHMTSNSDSSSTEAYFDLKSANPKLKLLYVTPEKIKASDSLGQIFDGLYASNKLAMFVIDECHCVSQWGHDFRPDYKELFRLRQKYPKVNFMALTATATLRVRQDILYQLRIKNPDWFVQSFNRSNLKYEIVPKTRTREKILKKLQRGGIFYKKSGIIYCLSRKECEQLADFLTAEGIKAKPYHAGLEDDERNSVQESWINEDDCKIVCATIAFGMGIDKPDETGRAGRDGIPSHCLLYYNYGDSVRLSKLLERDTTASREIKQLHTDNLHRVVQFCENKTDCRRTLILDYFGEDFTSDDCKRNKSTACDNCSSQTTHEMKDFTDIARVIVETVIAQSKQWRGNYTMLHYIDVFKGSCAKKITQVNHDSLAFFGMGKNMQRTDIERIFRKLVVDNFLAEKHIVFQSKFAQTYLIGGSKASLLLNNCVKFSLSFAVQANKSDSVDFNGYDNMPEASDLIEQCYNALVDIAKSISKEHGGKRYTTIFPVQMLRQMSQVMPSAKSDVLNLIDGFSEYLYERYSGDRLLKITQGFREKMPATATPKIIPASRKLPRTLMNAANKINNSKSTNQRPSKNNALPSAATSTSNWMRGNFSKKPKFDKNNKKSNASRKQNKNAGNQTKGNARNGPNKEVSVSKPISKIFSAMPKLN